MNLQNIEPREVQKRPQATAMELLHDCANSVEFSQRFADAAGSTLEAVVDQVVDGNAPKAVFLTGSMPLGMATRGSDVDLVVLIESRDALRTEDAPIANSEERMAFSNDSDSLRVGLFMSVMNGITVEVAAVVTPSIKKIYDRLRTRGPELSESEVMTLGRISTGWLLYETKDFITRNRVVLADPALNIYCSTKNFTFALIYRHKAFAAIELGDIPQALHLGRLSVEMAYLAYFASEGFPHLGPKWLAQLGHARGAPDRVHRHPILKNSLYLLFPTFGRSVCEARVYLEAASQLLTAMRNLIEQKTLYRIAYAACPQVFHIA